jgi:(1->4)-alpha-D-glucan 1-alpha-D-glucosylmutase
VVKLTAPGVPDTYQGTEFWDLSLVDPDNRRPVDYAARARLLEAAPTLTPELLAAGDGRIKQLVLARLLQLRRARPLLFARGSYRPLAVGGPAARHVVAYLRRDRREAMVVIVGRFFARLPVADAWRGTEVLGLPRLTTPLTDALSGQQIEPQSDRLDLERCFAALPATVLLTA